jgi:predicted transcriptional regulator
VKKTKKAKRPEINGLSLVEADVMQIVWREKNVTVREVHEELLQRGYVPYTTIMAAMNTLAQKGLLVQSRKYKAYSYTPALSQTAVANEIIDNVVSRVLQGSPTSILCYLLKIRNKDEVEELMKLREKLYS